MAERPLTGCRVVVTRETTGELGRLLDEAGAEVVHVPLIGIVDADDGGAALHDALGHLGAFDWLIVTSAAGADRVGASVPVDAGVRLGAVGTATARRLAELAQRTVDLVPDRQIADELADRFVERNAERAQRVLLALGERAAPTLADRLTAAGHEVTVVAAYGTALRTPDPDELETIAGCDALLFASGSAASAFADAVGEASATHLPARVVVIGPTTAAAARARGIEPTATAHEHSLPGLVAALVEVWNPAASR